MHVTYMAHLLEEEINILLLFTNDFCRYCHVYLLHLKGEVMNKFKIYKSEVEFYHEIFVKCLRPDRGGEYYNINYFRLLG